MSTRESRNGRKKQLKISLFGRTHSGPRKRRRKKKKKKPQTRNEVANKPTPRLQPTAKVFLPKKFHPADLKAVPESLPLKRYFKETQSQQKFKFRTSRLPLVMAEDTASNAALSVLDSGRTMAVRRVVTEYINTTIRRAFWETVWKTVARAYNPIISSVMFCVIRSHRYRE